MAEYYRHDKKLHVLVLEKSEAVHIIQLLTAQLADIGGGNCPDVVIQEDGANVHLSLTIAPDKKE